MMLNWKSSLLKSSKWIPTAPEFPSQDSKYFHSDNGNNNSMGCFVWSIEICSQSQQN